MATFEFEGHGSTLTALLFKGVTNCRELRQLVVSGQVNPEFAFVNAAGVLGPLQLQLAAHKALTNCSRGRLVTKTLHAELVYNLSGSKHIGESFKRFGVGDDTHHLLVARFNAAPEDLAYVRGLVQGGQEVELQQLADLADGSAAAKFFKVGDHELAVGSAEEAVACRLAVRDCS